MSDVALPITGGCLCGAIRYRIDARPGATALCHCRDCQKATGSAFAAVFSVRRSAFQLTRGEPRVLELRGDSGARVLRHFCAECGSPLFGKPDAMPRAVNVFAGTLDDPSWFSPVMNLFVDSAQPWVTLDERLKSHEGMPSTRDGA